MRQIIEMQNVNEHLSMTMNNVTGYDTSLSS